MSQNEKNTGIFIDQVKHLLIIFSSPIDHIPMQSQPFFYFLEFTGYFRIAITYIIR